MMATKVFIALMILLCFGKSFATQSVGAVPEDDEDLMTTATFTVEFTISRSCSESWYASNIQQFFDVLLDVILRGINEDCNNTCSFTSSNLQDRISCGGTHLIVNAEIIDWFSMDYPVSAILDNLKSRYINMTTPISLSTVSFTSGSIEGGLEITFANVSVSLTVMGMGSGEREYEINGTETTTLGYSPASTDGAECVRVSAIMVTLLAVMAAAILQIGTGY